jgi:hypothetical protein
MSETTTIEQYKLSSFSTVEEAEKELAAATSLRQQAETFLAKICAFYGFNVTRQDGDEAQFRHGASRIKSAEHFVHFLDGREFLAMLMILAARSTSEGVLVPKELPLLEREILALITGHANSARLAITLEEQTHAGDPSWIREALDDFIEESKSWGQKDLGGTVQLSPQDRYKVKRWLAQCASMVGLTYGVSVLLRFQQQSFDSPSTAQYHFAKWQSH